MLHPITIITTSLLLAGLVPTSRAQAQDSALDLRQVPASAEWAGHLDVGMFLKSAVGGLVLEQMKRPDREAGLTVLQNMSGLDLTRDIRSITVFGVGAGEDQNAALIAGRFERDKITTLLRTNPTLRQRKLGERQLYEWTDEPRANPPGPERFGMFYRDDLIIIAGSEELLELCVSVLDGQAPALDTSAPVWQPTPQTYLGLYLAKMPMPVEREREAVLLEKIKSGRMEIGERDGRQLVLLSLETVSARTATNLQRMGQGMLAMLDFARDIREEGRPALPPAAEKILADMQFASSDTMVTASMATPVENVVEALAWMAEQAERRRSPEDVNTEK